MTLTPNFIMTLNLTFWHWRLTIESQSQTLTLNIKFAKKPHSSTAHLAANKYSRVTTNLWYTSIYLRISSPRSPCVRWTILWSGSLLLMSFSWIRWDNPCTSQTLSTASSCPTSSGDTRAPEPDRSNIGRQCPTPLSVELVPC